VLESPVPARASSTLDIERMAFATPGARLARVRAFRDLDLDVACVDAPGTLSVVVVPFLPRGEPRPTPGLLDLVARRLCEHRTLGTRLRVCGPTYVDVSVAATVIAADGVDRVRLATDVELAVRRFLDPLVGGSAGRGWPFGRDVYRAEVMQVVSAVPGIHLVADVEVSTDPCDACPNACVPAGALVRVAALDVEVRR
jgi:predicted phage baseplate assembly protein